jgi:vacuolar-type H+-ATPase subunit I/STV1
VNLHDTIARQEKVAELQEQILDAQESAIGANQERVTLIETISELKQKVAQLEAWNTEKERYKKVEVTEGVIAYTLKEGTESGEPAHYACTDCYSDKKISILKSETWCTLLLVRSLAAIDVARRFISRGRHTLNIRNSDDHD